MEKKEQNQNKMENENVKNTAEIEIKNEIIDLELENDQLTNEIIELEECISYRKRLKLIIKKMDMDKYNNMCNRELYINPKFDKDNYINDYCGLPGCNSALIDLRLSSHMWGNKKKAYYDINNEIEFAQYNINVINSHIELNNNKIEQLKKEL